MAEPIRYRLALALGQRIKLDPVTVRALKAREVNVKEAFTLCDAEGRYFRASLQACEADRGEAVVYESFERSPEAAVPITLVCAVLSRQRMLTVCQKATELGVDRIVPVFSEKSVGPEGLAHEKSHAWPGQLLRAVKQCRRSSVPTLTAAMPLAEALGDVGWRDADARLVLDDRMRESTDVLASVAGAKRVVLAVGPEGGWTERELRLMLDAGGRVLQLGGRVLRAETAVFAGLAVVAHRLGDLR